MKTDEFLDRLDQKLDRQSDKLAEIARVQERQEVVLAEHIRRTEALETLVEALKRDAVTWPFVGKVIAGLGGAGAAAKGLWEFLKPHP